MTDKELLRGEIRETIRLYRLGLNKKTLEALVDDMEAIFKQEIKRVIGEDEKVSEFISDYWCLPRARNRLKAQQRRKVGD